MYVDFFGFLLLSFRNLQECREMEFGDVKTRSSKTILMNPLTYKFDTWEYDEDLLLSSFTWVSESEDKPHKNVMTNDME